MPDAPADRQSDRTVPLVSDERLAEIRDIYAPGLTISSASAVAVVQELLAEVDRLREREAYLTGLFYGITEFFGHLCPKHAAIPLAERDLSRTIVPACQGCQEDDLRALVAGNPEATTMAERLKESGDRNLSLMIENHRLRERVPPGSPLLPIGGGPAGDGAGTGER